MQPPNYIIRDATSSDIPKCVAIDHSYSTDIVWQMNSFNDDGVWQISFRSGRLPRSIEVQRPTFALRLQQSLAPEQCFLIATDQEDASTVLGYMIMHVDGVYRTATIYDLVVDRPLRQTGIATRLLRIARQWAQERDIQRILAEVRTKNYPAIQFFQKNGLSFCGFNDQYLPAQDIAVFFGQTLR